MRSLIVFFLNDAWLRWYYRLFIPTIFLSIVFWVAFNFKVLNTVYSVTCSNTVSPATYCFSKVDLCFRKNLRLLNLQCIFSKMIQPVSLYVFSSRPSSISIHSYLLKEHILLKGQVTWVVHQPHISLWAIGILYVLGVLSVGSWERGSYVGSSAVFGVLMSSIRCHL